MSLKDEINFGLKFLSHFNGTAAAIQKPIIFSPASILNGLAIIFLGTNGNTAYEIAQVIGKEASSNEKICQYYSKSSTNQDLPGDEDGDGIKVLYANKLFISKTKSLMPQFSVLMKQMFNSDVQSLDFHSITAVEEINVFVKNATNNKIEKIIAAEDIKFDTSVILVNALHFSGSWRQKFDTRQSQLFRSNPPREVEMMTKLENEWNYAEGKEWTALGIPYHDKMAYMYIVLPKSDDGLADIIDKMDYNFFMECTKSNMNEQITVSIPCFETAHTFELQQLLIKMGITEVFNYNCDLSGMLKDQTKLDTVIHRASIKVDENGTEASAATDFNFVTRCKKLVFKADHPFLYFITLNEIIYEGKKKVVNIKKLLFVGTFC